MLRYSRKGAISCAFPNFNEIGSNISDWRSRRSATYMDTHMNIAGQVFERAAVLTQWQAYKDEDVKEANLKANEELGSFDWAPLDQLTAESLPTVTAQRKASKLAANSFSGTTFVRVLPVNLVKLQKAYIKMGMYATETSHEHEISALKNVVLQVCKKVAKYETLLGAQAPRDEETIASQESRIDEAFDRAIKEIKEFQAKSAAYLETISKSPYSEDLRSLPRFIEVLDNFYMSSPEMHKTYEKVLENAFVAGTCNKDFRQEDCWRWKGEHDGAAALVRMGVVATRALVRVAACFKSLAEHKEDPTYFTLPEEEAKQEQRETEDTAKQAARLLDLLHFMIVENDGEQSEEKSAESETVKCPVS